MSMLLFEVARVCGWLVYSLAEATGLILPIGERVPEQTCLQIKTIQQQCGIPLKVAVNLSTKLKP